MGIASYMDVEQAAHITIESVLGLRPVTLGGYLAFYLEERLYAVLHPGEDDALVLIYAQSPSDAVAKVKEKLTLLSSDDDFCAGWVKGWNAQAEIRGECHNDHGHCDRCGEIMYDSPKFCSNCGARVVEDE